ncbi:hypothetical protein GCM10020220_085280 [Nonomuraea rubra]|uniref:molybdopterin-dependent oxidoreductase n=1 Tax=Nonomuraea rubra TaxID=46180 RepID=UPI00336D9ADF
MAGQVAEGRLGFACEDPDAPANWPRVLTVWRANLLGSSAKGNEYFLRHLLGADSAVRADEAAPEQRPEGVAWPQEAPRGKLDLLLSLDFRMTSTTLFSDIVLPAATWYEKHDLSSTDMHPFVHAFTPAIDPPWQTRTDFAAFHAIAKAFSGLAKTHLGTRTDLVAVPLLHDTADELATPHGRVHDWRATGGRPTPGRDFPKLVTVERDYGAVADKMAALGPLLERLGATTKGLTFDVSGEIDRLGRMNGTVRGGVADGTPVPGQRRRHVRGHHGPVGHHQRALWPRRVGRAWGIAEQAASGPDQWWFFPAGGHKRATTHGTSRYISAQRYSSDFMRDKTRAEPLLFFSFFIPRPPRPRTENLATEKNAEDHRQKHSKEGTKATRRVQTDQALPCR